MNRSTTKSVIFTLALCTIVSAGEPTFEDQVRPILKTHCFHCHGERGVKEGQLDLRLRRFIVDGGESGAAIVPGNAKASLLLQRVEQGEMPPGDEKQLTAAEIQVLRRWVNQGGKTRTTEPKSLDSSQDYFTPAEKNWWAFQPVTRPPVPTMKTAVQTPIDAFLIFRAQQQLTNQLLASEKSPEKQRVSIEFAPLADRITRIRRLSLTLRGIPPRPDEVQRFVADRSPDAWRRLVDRMLASPAYGERWGRHWLDAAGYADSEGYTDSDNVRPHAWRYRDYVIRAMNNDKSYAQFLMEQLAGDELANWPATKELTATTVERLAATGFLRMAPDGTATDKQTAARNQVIADTLQVVGTTVLGMSVHCSQCHDHRYDPIPQRNYYEMRAIFAPALNWKKWQIPAQRQVSLYRPEDRRQREQFEAQAKQVDRERQAKVDFYIARTLEHELLMLPDELQQPLRKAFQTATAKRTAADKKLLEQHVNVANIRAGSLYLYDRRRTTRANDLDARRKQRLAQHITKIRTKAWQEIEQSIDRQQLLELRKVDSTSVEQRTPEQQQLLKRHPRLTVTEKTLAKIAPRAAADLRRYEVAAAEIRKFRIRTDLQTYTDRAAQIRKQIPVEHFLRILSEVPGQIPTTHVFHRGDSTQPREAVTPRGLAILASMTDSGAAAQSAAKTLTAASTQSTSQRRLRYAKSLTTGKHPLVARVIVNRIWAHHFGRGIVATTGDFGFLGERPTHPQLLDWLASELVQSDWSIKHLHRLILTSRVYQQRAHTTPEVTLSDAENRWLLRWPMRRLESEAIRDSMLAVSGVLERQMYGEPIPVMEDSVGQIVLGKENLDGERKPTKPVPLHADEFRRSVYVQVRRSRPLGVLEPFDLPSMSPNCHTRPVSNVAPQALMLLNNQFVINMSEKMAQRLRRQAPQQLERQIDLAWQLVYGQSPQPQEAAQLQAYFIKQQAVFAARQATGKVPADQAALATLCQALLSSSRFLYIP